MKNKLLHKIAISLLCIASAIMLFTGVIAVVSNTKKPSIALADTLVSPEDVFDITSGGKGLSYSAKQTTVASSNNVLTFLTKVKDMKDGSKLEDIIGDYIVVGTDTESYTATEWKTKNSGNRVFRIAVYGYDLYLQFEKESLISKSKAKYVTFKEGFTLYEGTDNSDTDWVFTHLATTKVENSTLNADLKLYVNTETNRYEYAADSLTIKTAPATTTYTVGDSFDASNMVLEVTSGNTTKDITVISNMCSYDFSSSGAKDVTVSYGGKTVTQSVTVNEPEKTVTSIALKSDVAVTVEQYKKVATVPTGAKIVVNWSDVTSEEVDIAPDMISGFTNETTGTTGNATVTYKGQTCGIDYTVTAYTGTSSLQSIKYGEALRNEGVGGFEFNRTDSTGLKSLWDIDKAASAVIGKEIGDFVTIGGETVTSLVANGKVARMWVYGTYIGFHVDDTEYRNAFEGKEIALLPGFSWVTYGGDSWGTDNSANYSIIEETILTTTMYLTYKDGQASKVLESVTLSGTPKDSYNMGDTIDVSNLTLKVVYKGFEEESVQVTADMCDYDFSEAGEKTVSINYEGKTVTFSVDVTAITVTGLTLVSAPTKTTYDFGIDNELNLEGLSVKASYSDGSEQVVANASMTFDGFNSHAFGTQTITATYGVYNVTFDISVQNISTDKYLFIDYQSSSPSYESSQHNSLVIPFIINGVTVEKLGVFWKVDQYEYVADYMLINGVKVSDLIKEGKVTRLAVWTNQLVIHLDTSGLVATTEHSKYVEGTSEVVKTVTFLPGFQWYNPEVPDDSLWGKDSYTGAIPIVGAVLKEKIELTNLDGYGWQRALKKDADGTTIASDALTIASLPDKVKYVKGESLNVKGMYVLAKYADGGEERIAVGYSDVEGYKKNTLGEQTLTYTYNGASVTFKVTVEEESSNSGDNNNNNNNNNNGNSNSGCSCSSSIALGNIILITIVLVCVATVVIIRKKKQQ